MLLKDLAAGLGISPAMVTKLKKRGMPTASVKAAEKWRRENLGFARTKGTRAGSERNAPGLSGDVSTFAERSAGLVDARTAMALRQVEELGLLADDALTRGAFATVAPMLRQAMARVPLAARDRIGLTMEVWDALTAAIPLGEGGAPGAGDEDLPDDFMAVFWQQIALGEYADMAITGWPGTDGTPLGWTKK